MPLFVSLEGIDFKYKGNRIMFGLIMASIILSLLTLFVFFLSSISILWLRISLISLSILGCIILITMIFIDLVKEPAIEKIEEDKNQ